MLGTQTKNLYEAVVIFRPNLSDEDLDKNIMQVESAIKNNAGSIVKVEKVMRNRLTHKIKGFKDGFYVSFLFNSPPEVPNTLRRTLSITDDVLRHMVIFRES